MHTNRIDTCEKPIVEVDAGSHPASVLSESLCPDFRKNIFFRNICLPFSKELSPIPDDGKQPSKFTYRQALFCSRCGFHKWA